ncbi:MAG: hypothetical protein ACFHWX_15715 [Bacteroidota bacterium]
MKLSEKNIKHLDLILDYMIKYEHPQLWNSIDELKIDDEIDEDLSDFYLDVLEQFNLIEQEASDSMWRPYLREKIRLFKNDGGFTKFLENQKKENNRIQSDFSAEEIIIINNKLDLLLIHIPKLELGQEIIYEDLTSEINELRDLVYSVKKKTWFEVLKGKMISLGLGTLTEKGFKLIKDIFDESKFLN